MAPYSRSFCGCGGISSIIDYSRRTSSWRRTCLVDFSAWSRHSPRSSPCLWLAREARSSPTGHSRAARSPAGTLSARPTGKPIDGELVGTPKSADGGWLVLDKSFQDVEFGADFKCVGDCRTGVLLRAEKTPTGMKGVFLSLDAGRGRRLCRHARRQRKDPDARAPASRRRADAHCAFRGRDGGGRRRAWRRCGTRCGTRCGRGGPGGRAAACCPPAPRCPT